MLEKIRHYSEKYSIEIGAIMALMFFLGIFEFENIYIRAILAVLSVAIVLATYKINKKKTITTN